MRKQSIIFFSTLLLCGITLLCEKKESFVVKKKKSIKAGRKSKEQACRGFAQCVKSGAQLVERVAKVQDFGLERTVQYLDGDDPFSGAKKTDIQELVHRSQELEKLMCDLRKKCDEYIQYTNGLFVKKQKP